MHHYAGLAHGKFFKAELSKTSDTEPNQ